MLTWRAEIPVGKNEWIMIMTPTENSTPLFEIPATWIWLAVEGVTMNFGVGVTLRWFEVAGKG